MTLVCILRSDVLLSDDFSLRKHNNNNQQSNHLHVVKSSRPSLIRRSGAVKSNQDPSIVGKAKLYSLSIMETN